MSVIKEIMLLVIVRLFSVHAKSDFAEPRKPMTMFQKNLSCVNSSRSSVDSEEGGNDTDCIARPSITLTVPSTLQRY